MTASLANSALTVLPTVLATAVPTTNSARKLKKAEKAGAHLAGSARVATTVPTELAASWKPFVKSKMSATTMSTPIVISARSTSFPSGDEWPSQ
jgi:hypothetical protein